MTLRDWLLNHEIWVDMGGYSESHIILLSTWWVSGEYWGAGTEECHEERYLFSDIGSTCENGPEPTIPVMVLLRISVTWNPSFLKRTSAQHVSCTHLHGTVQTSLNNSSTKPRLFAGEPSIPWCPGCSDRGTRSFPTDTDHKTLISGLMKGFI